MKRIIDFTKLMKKVSFYFFILGIMASCNSLKRVADNEQLLKTSTLVIDGKKNRDMALYDYVIQKPNTRLLGLPISLYFHNIGNPKAAKTAKEWGIRNPKKYNFFKNLFSEKQSIGVAKSQININNWFLKNGEAPVIIDDLKTKKTVKNLNTYFKTMGYWKNTVFARKDTIKEKKGAITYTITKKNALFLDSVSTEIPSPTLQAIYQRDASKTFLRKGDQYNEQNLINEVKRIVKLFRNSGISNFTDSYIYFDEIDTLGLKTKVITTIAENTIETINGLKTKTPFQIQKIKKVQVYTDYTYNERDLPYLDSITYKGVTFFAHKKIKYNPKYLVESILIKPNQIYSDTLRNLTRDHLRSLNNFKAISIHYTPVPKSPFLIANIQLTPREKYTIGAETELTHSNIRALGVSAKFSASNRNLFKGAEVFKSSFTGSFFNTSNQPGSSSGFFNAWELGIDLSLEIPRFFAPFGLHRLVPKKMYPKTLFSVGTAIQKNIGLDRQTINANVNYKWKFNEKKSINFELFNVQFIRNLNTAEYFNIYSSEFNKLLPIAEKYDNFPLTSTNAPTFMNTVKQDPIFRANHPSDYNANLNIENRYAIVTSNFIIPTIAYTYTYSNQTNYKDNNFSFFKVRLSNAGNLVALASNTTNENGIKTISDTPVAQYLKTDIEYKKFWNVSRNAVIGFRSFLGAIVAYGKSDIPFTKSYFAGGSNDIRAWKTYELGLGSSPPGLEFNVGNFKFLTSLEYRFDLISSLKGALFIDAGNIWDISNSSFTDDRAKFNSLSSLKKMAVGSGFGARYDFNFLILRLDIGFKTHEPYLTGNKWFKNYNFNNAVYNIGINYPF